MAKKSKEPGDSKNWGLLSRRDTGQTLQNRDVYDTQQLERGTIGKKQTFTVRHIMAIAAGVLVFLMVWLFYSLAEIGSLQEAADAEASRVKPITEMAPAEPRDLTPVQWLNLELVRRPENEQFGYFYGDVNTHAYYTEAEFEIWKEVNDKFYARSDTVDYYPEVWRYYDESSQTYYFAERPYLDTAPAEPRPFSLAEYANMKPVPCHDDSTDPIDRHCYHDKGYTYKDPVYQRYLTAAEYAQWQKVSSSIPQLQANGEIVYSEEGGPHYIMPDDTSDVSAEVITEDAGDRVFEPIKLDDIVWANMDLVPATKYTQFRYSYADIRTGKFYTSAEYNLWSEIQGKISRREEGYYFWREEDTKFGGYDYYLKPPENAPNIERDKFRIIQDLDLLLMDLIPDDYWTEYGYPYVDTNTGDYYSEIEYKRWNDMQERAESGEVRIPQGMADYIRAERIHVSDIVWNNMPLPEVKIGINDAFKHFALFKIFLSLALGGITYVILREILKRNLAAQNMMEDTSDINQYENDQHIALPEEIQRKFDWFPDVGAHSPVMVSSMVSHMMLTNKGLNKIAFAKRAEDDIYDEDGNLEYYKGEILLDADGNPITELVPFIDEDFGDALFESSGNPKEVRKKYSTAKIPYNPGGKDRSKQSGKWNTVAEMINNEWKFPLYEPQRPAGAFLVDTEPVNTMV